MERTLQTANSPTLRAGSKQPVSIEVPAVGSVCVALTTSFALKMAWILATIGLIIALSRYKDSYPHNLLLLLGITAAEGISLGATCVDFVPPARRAIRGRDQSKDGMERLQDSCFAMNAVAFSCCLPTRTRGSCL